MTPPRQCFYIPVEQYDENGYIPSLVTENEAGHHPLIGSGVHAVPWYWGKTYEEAKATARAENLMTFGLNDEACLEIIASSMRQQ